MDLRNYAFAWLSHREGIIPLNAEVARRVFRGCMALFERLASLAMHEKDKRPSQTGVGAAFFVYFWPLKNRQEKKRGFHITLH